MTLAPAAAPWAGETRLIIGMLMMAAIGVLVFAFALAHWTVRDERGWWKMVGLLPMLLGVVLAGGYAFAVWVVSALVRVAV